MVRGRIAVLGATGQLGRALMDVLGDEAVGYGRDEADLCRPDEVIGLLQKSSPAMLVNAAAYTQVDMAESEQEVSHTINSLAPDVLAEWAAEEGIPFIHFSTDYVFDGSGNDPWQEDDETRPLNKYGESKLAGEQAVLAAGGREYIFRLSWVYDAVAKNFFTSILAQAKAGNALRVVDDQHGAPSYAPDLALWVGQAIGRILSGNPPLPEVYHLCHGGEVSRYGFARELVKQAHEAGLIAAPPTIEPVPGTAFVTPAQRPLNSRLDCRKFREAFGVVPDDWQKGLAHAIASLRRMR
jgi:dTDP-4-dehydrorhamnose reductase